MPSTPDPIATAAAAEVKRLAALPALVESDSALHEAIGAVLNLPTYAAVPDGVPDDQIWHQDKIQRPVNSINAVVNPYLAARDRMHAFYPVEYTVTAAGGFFETTFAIELNRMFFISNITCLSYSTATQVLSSAKPGYFSLIDNRDGYRLFDAVPLQALRQITATVPDNLLNKSTRTIWPLPYGIGAGGSFRSQLYVPATAGLVTVTCAIVIEGWWDFTHAG